MTASLDPADCTFCQILGGKLPATLLHRDDRCAVFMDIRPVNTGHLLVIPNEHAPFLADVSSQDLERMIGLAQRYAAGLRASGLPCEGVNLFLADGPAAMQEVFHAHLHVFPRYRGDGFGLRFGPHYAVQERVALERAAGMIRMGISKLEQ